MKGLAHIGIIVLLIIATGCQAQQSTEKNDKKLKLQAPAGKAIAAFAEGCFWCSEHIFEAVVGVESAVSGYAGGTVRNPTDELVNTETTGHAETVLVYYNPKVVSDEELTHVFFTSHDPTTPNQQGPDRGSSYRSILFFMNSGEEKIAKKALSEYSTNGLYDRKIVSEIKKLTAFYRAEEYHQDYIEHHPQNSYVVTVSIPRFEKFKRTYKGKLK
jgi:peptide-methionine (S)-S-oxide reductase